MLKTLVLLALTITFHSFANIYTDKAEDSVVISIATLGKTKCEENIKELRKNLKKADKVIIETGDCVVVNEASGRVIAKVIILK